MILESLKLSQFRNYTTAEPTFSNHINVIAGPNAQGKTNLLEAVFFLSRGYSHRATTVAELSTFGTPAFYVAGEVNQKEVHHSISVRYENRRKILMVDRKKESKQAAASKVLGTILFEPEDLRIVKAGPEKRRRFMDEEIGGYLPHYNYILKQYKKVLHQRNALLKELRSNTSLAVTLDTWDEQLVNYGAQLMAYRVDYLKRLNAYARRLHTMMSSGAEELSLFYQNNILMDLREEGDIKSIFTERMAQSRAQDMDRGSTTFGPHVDDIIIHINGREARKYGSQGQQRTAAISLKLSQIDIYKQSTGDYPIVLLDDILSELDDHRQEKILSVLGKTQAFITCTDSSFASRYSSDEVKEFRISGGSIHIVSGGNNGR